MTLRLDTAVVECVPRPVSGSPARVRSRADIALMIGTGASLNVAVAGSLVLYRLAGLL